MHKHRILRYAAPVVIALALYGVYRFAIDDIMRHPRDYDEIAADSTLHAVAEQNALGFYQEGDSLSGFYYELISTFAADHGLKLDIVPEMNMEKRLDGLRHGHYDIVADGVAVTADGDDESPVLFSTPIVMSHLVLVQRKEEASAATDSIRSDSTTFVRSLVNLAGKTLHVAKGSQAVMRIEHLAEEIGDTIYIYEDGTHSSEQLIAMVASGDIDYTVCERRIAELAADSLNQIDIYTPVSFNQFYSWAVSRKSPVLLDSINAWLDRYQQTEAYRQLYRRYYLKVGSKNSHRNKLTS